MTVAETLAPIEQTYKIATPYPRLNMASIVQAGHRMPATVGDFRSTIPLRYNGAMENPSTYIPLDRRCALLNHQTLPDRTQGAALFADISGFTRLTEALARLYGPRRGADEFTRQLNRVYTAIIAEIHRLGGSVIGFSGDAIMCWFDSIEERRSGGAEEKGAARRATAAALAIQQVMAHFANLEVAPGEHAQLTIKTAVAAGAARRFAVGDPAISMIDVLAGSLLDRVAAAEQLANQGELILDSVASDLLHNEITITDWRKDDGLAAQFAVVTHLSTATDQLLTPLGQTGILDSAVHSPHSIQGWLLPAVYERVTSQHGGRFLAELRPATALFVKFSGIDYDNDEAAGKKLDAYIRWVQSVLTRYEGALIQLTTGDKGSYLYAAFGAPLAHDDDNERAVAAALDLRTPPLHLSFMSRVQIGISQGLMRVGPYGSDTRRTYGVLGDATNLAARLMNRAAPGEILISENLVAGLAEQFDLEHLGFVTLKGKADPQLLHRVRGRLPQSTRQYTQLHADPLVGRAAELAVIDDVIDDVIDGVIDAVTEGSKGHILRIEGEAGVGKSHLAAVATQHARERNLQVVIGACQSTSRDIAYFPIRQMARYMLGLSNNAVATSEAEQQEQIAYLSKVIEHLNPDWMVRLPLLGDLLGLPIPDNATTAAFDAQLRREALTALAIEILQTGARLQPTLLLVEDAHWMDEASQSIALALGRVIADAPLLLVMVQRPATADNESFFSQVAELTNQTHLSLNELSRDGTAALIANRLHGRVSALVSDLVHARGQGNPFFTEELVDALQEAGRLIPLEGGWALSASLMRTLQGAGCLVRTADGWALAPHADLSTVDLGVPDTVHGIVLARLDRLPEPVKLTVKVASVIGRIFEFEMLSAAHPVEAERTALLQQIETLAARDFARLETPAPNLSYIFKHNITQEAVYRTLVEEQQQELHLAVGQVLEDFQPDAVERLAHHFYSSDLTREPVRDRALHYLDAAGRRAQRDYANETALTYFDRALALEERWEWLKAKVEVLHILGRREEERVLLAVCKTYKSAPALELGLLESSFHEAVSEYEDAQAAVDRALALCRNLHDVRGEVRCLIQAGQIAGKQGDFRTKENYLRKALILIPRDDSLAEEETEIRYGLGIVNREHSQYENALEEFHHAVRLAQRTGDQVREARILSAIGFTAQLQRDFKAAFNNNSRALTLRTAIGDRRGEGASLVNLAQVIVDSKGDISRAKESLSKALRIQTSIGNRWSQALIWNELGIVYNVVGEYADAQESLEESHRLCLEIGAEVGRSHVLCNLGQTYRELTNRTQAALLLKEALGLSQKSGDALQRAYIHSELALTYMEDDALPHAVEYATTSLQIYQELKLDVLTTTSLALLAVTYMKLADLPKALHYANRALEILQTHDDNGPKHPQRDYYYCSLVFAAAHHLPFQRKALCSAYDILMRQANNITDRLMRHAFLQQVPVHREIVCATKALDTPCDT